MERSVRQAKALSLRFRWATREFLWPRRCAACGMRDTWLCDACAKNLELWQPFWCARCGVPSEIEHCRCDAIPRAIGQVRSLGWYEGWFEQSVSLIKYGREAARAASFGPLMARQIRDLPAHDLIVPVPLHHRRESERGFNQSAELASALAFETGRAVSRDLVTRVIYTRPQVGLPRDERELNVRGAFETTDPERIRRKSVLLVDDVFTTGSTVGEIARLLRSAGATRVDVVTVARALDRHPA